MRKPTQWLFLFLALSISSVVWGGELLNNKYEDGITLTITSKPFDAKAHVIKKCDEAVCSIDGKFFYGGYGNIPKEEVTRLVFEKKGKKIALDVSSMYDSGVNNVNIKQYVKVVSWGGGAYRVTGYFSVGIGGDGDGDEIYICQWLVSPEGAIRNYIGGYETLVSLTTKVQEDFKLPSTTGPNTNQ